MDELARHSELLEKPCFATVATSRPDGRLSATPVSIMWDSEGLWFSSKATTKKIRNLGEDPRIAVAILDPDNPANYLEVRGHARLKSDSDRGYINRVAKKFMGVEEYPYDPPGMERVTVFIDPEVVSSPTVHGDN